MSRRNIYDNWGRLVSEVLKREQNRQLCYDHSRSPSILSKASDFGSTIPDDVSINSPSSWLQTERLDAQRDHKEKQAIYTISEVVSIAMNLMEEKKLTVAARLTKLMKKLFRQYDESVPRPASYESSMKLFTYKELKKATDNFARDNKLEPYGFRQVYKGILHDNKQLVAIKRLGETEEFEFFITKVTILGEVNHPHIRKLLGCCLERKCILLVYEHMYGTLFDRIHNDEGIYCSWGNRLKVASEVAGALAYLHSLDIIHANVSSSNILMDEYYTAKISCFGSSILIPPIDETEDDGYPTPVRGTVGYVDPEYYLTGKLTRKSDVYSFGVVLAELMTGRKVISYKEMEAYKRNLATLFVTSLEENLTFQILDSCVIAEDCIEQLSCAAQLVKRCLSLHGEERPDMKEVVADLEVIRNMKFGDTIQSGAIGWMPEWPSDSNDVTSDLKLWSTP